MGAATGWVWRNEHKTTPDGMGVVTLSGRILWHCRDGRCDGLVRRNNLRCARAVKQMTLKQFKEGGRRRRGEEEAEEERRREGEEEGRMRGG